MTNEEKQIEETVYNYKKRLYKVWINMKQRCYNPNTTVIKPMVVRALHFVKNGEQTFLLLRNGLWNTAMTKTHQNGNALLIA